MPMLRILYRALTSVRLAVGLLRPLSVLSVVATLVPQRQDAGGLVAALGLDRFWTSPLFLGPAGVFLLSLGTCTVDRVVRRSRTGAPARFGPDIVHLGLLVLAVGGILTATGRREGFAYLAEGDQVMITDDYEMTLLGYRFDRYPDGRPHHDLPAPGHVHRGHPVFF
jgi:cytochrome c biogenesis protein ResB